jgi:hypothetical protein
MLPALQQRSDPKISQLRHHEQANSQDDGNFACYTAIISDCFF